MRNPCLTCDLKDKSKDNPTCKDCDARCDYVRFLDGPPPDTSIKLSDISGNQAGNAEKGDNTMDKIKPARLYIQKVCEKKFITIDDLKSQRYAGGLGDIKREVINTLYHQYKLTQKEIAHLFGKSENAIWMMLQKKSKQTQPVEPLKKSEGGHIDHEQINFANPPAAGELVMVGRQSSLKKPSSDDKKLFIIVDFKNHIDLYNFLIKSAETNFRKPEDHILYLINHERAGADEDKEVLSYGTG